MKWPNLHESYRRASFFERRVAFFASFFVAIYMPVDKFDDSDLQILRNLPCDEVLPLICTFIKADRDYKPLKNGYSQRWHINVDGQDYELLTTHSKFFDTHTQAGGGGAIDLIMYLKGLRFKSAVKTLRKLLNTSSSTILK